MIEPGTAHTSRSEPSTGLVAPVAAPAGVETLAGTGQGTAPVTGVGPADTEAVWHRILTTAARAYGGTDAHARRFARAKLGHDRVFRHVLTLGLVTPGARVLDLGCGQGLFAGLLAAAAATARAGAWPSGWASPPLDAFVTGIDPLPVDIERAGKALGAAATFILGDMRSAPLPPADVVVFFDTLHYISLPEQDAVLGRARDVLAPGGVMLLRVHDATHRLRYRYGLWVDRFTMLLHGGGFGRLAGRTPEQWATALQSLGLQTTSLPMNGRPPFKNRLIVGRLPAAAAVAAASPQDARR